MSDKIEIPVCKMCGRELAVKVSEHRAICVSDYIPDNPYCYSCQIEHCLETNCLGCEMGKYPNCRHLGLKRFYLEAEYY